LKRLILFIILCMFLDPIQIKAEEINLPYEESIDYDALQTTVDQIVGNDTFDFKAFVLYLVKSGQGVSIASLGDKLISSLKEQIVGEKSLLVRLGTILLFAAIFANFTEAFRNRQVAEIGHYICYLILFSIAMVSFQEMMELAVTVLTNVQDFMRALVPAYYMALMFSSGVTTSGLFYQGILIVIQIVERVILQGILPMIRVYFLLSMMNNLTKEGMFSKMTELLESLIRWLMKGFLGAVTGYHVMQGLLVPITDSLKNRIAIKTMNLLPGVGNVLGTAASTVISAGIVIKNAIGVAGLIVLLLILSVPLLRLLFSAMVYKVFSAVAEPISDKRIIACLGATYKAISLLLYVTFITGILFMLTIVIVMATTNGRV
ncbi:MAG: stage sporulation protein, partial [Clostridiales bacterium]|nr:stage sporulation protein [Clostridiales bacterium]